MLIFKWRDVVMFQLKVFCYCETLVDCPFLIGRSFINGPIRVFRIQME